MFLIAILRLHFFLCVPCVYGDYNKTEGCCRLPAIAVDCPALTHTQIAADGRGGRVAFYDILNKDKGDY
jgi:hypothetical protein